MSNEQLLEINPPADRQQLGRYRLVTTLGQGGMGTIHLAVVGGLGEFRKLLVVKELRRDLACNRRFVEMFLQEAKLAARLTHANVVQTLEAGQVDDRYFLSMEFLDGQPFSELVARAKEEPRVTLELRLQVLCDALAGLHYAHELRDYDGRALEIVHRDMSPQNVFITYEGQVKVVDFGIAKAVDADSGTHHGLFKGKLGYAASEQLRGRPVDRRTDIFAVGVMLWEAIALRRFASGPVTQQAINARVSGSEPRIAAVMPQVDPALAAICDRAIHNNPAARFATADEFRVALQTYLASRGHVVNVTEMGRFMMNKFVAERIAMHQLIDSGIKDESTTSMVREVRFDDVPGDDEATTVADLSELVEISRPSSIETLRPPELTNPFARKSSTRWWVASGAVVAVTGLTLALYSGNREPAATDSPPQRAVSAPAPMKQTAAQDEAPAAAEIPAAELEPDAVSASARTKASTSRHRPTLSPGVKPARSAVERSVRAAAAPQTEPATSLSPPAVPAPAATEKRAQPTATPPAPSLGRDLRTTPKRERRSLDVENPFE